MNDGMICSMCSRLEDGEGKGEEGYDQETLYLERYQDDGWQSRLAS